jgi:DNA-binding NarL/FixJ family response regulator
MTVRVILVDDEPLVRTGIGLILRGEKDIDTVGFGGDGREALMLVERCKPDVVVMDVRMPVMDGVRATAEIVARASAGGHDCAVLILSTYHADDGVREALRAGASGFILKDAAPDELLAAVRAVADGEAWLDPAVAKQLLREFRGRPVSVTPTPAEMAAITQREREVLVLAAHGLSNGEIARHLVVAEATVKTHLNRILMKLGMRDRTQAVVAAYRSGLVSPDDPPPPARH